MKTIEQLEAYLQENKQECAEYISDRENITIKEWMEWLEDLSFEWDNETSFDQGFIRGIDMAIQFLKN